MAIPPADGYGAAGNVSAGIKGTDTLVFVVDVVASYSHSVTGDLQAHVLSSGVNGISVTGPLGQPPSVHIGAAPSPTSPMVTILAKGDGPPVTPGLVVVQFVAVDWSTGSVVQSTWQEGSPDGEVVGQPATPGALDLLVGIPVGSRVLLQIPKNFTGRPVRIRGRHRGPADFPVNVDELRQCRPICSFTGRNNHYFNAECG